jgi:tetratricopeptide (TPR) repeat protein
LAAASPEVVRVHDIVAESIAHLLKGDDTDGIVRELVQFIEAQMGETHSMTLQRIVRYHFRLFEELLLGGSTDPALRYAYALSRRPGLNRDLLGHPLTLVGTLANLGAKVSIAVRSIIEGIECTYTLVSQEQGTDSAKKTLQGMFPAYEQMLTIPGLPRRIERDLKHHRGKALHRLGRFEEAAAAFEEVLGADPEFPAAELQLARALARTNNRTGEALAHLEAVFQFAEQRPDDLNLSIVLGAFETLTWSALKPSMLVTIEAHKTLLFDSLRRALKFGHDQPHKVIAALGLKLHYDAPSLFLELVELVPERLSPAETDEELFAWAQTLKNAGKAFRETNPERAHSFFEEAVTFYLQLKKPDEFMITQSAEGMLLVERASDAVKLLDRISTSRRKEFWHHRMAEALKMQGDFHAALVEIDLALAVQESSYRSTYLHERFKIRVGLADADARDDLDRAIVECKHPKFKRQLETERDALGK